jgi:Domain of unknown function (DUF4440)
MMAAPRPFTELKADDVRIRLLGDFAIIHAYMTFRKTDGVLRQGRYTDDWQRREGQWLCVAANVISESGQETLHQSDSRRSVEGSFSFDESFIADRRQEEPICVVGSIGRGIIAFPSDRPRAVSIRTTMRRVE